MENLTWRMMSANKAEKDRRKLQSRSQGLRQDLQPFITSPVLEQLKGSDTPQTSVSAEEFDYVAHIRRMSRDVKSLPRTQNVSNRKRPASSLPFLLATTNVMNSAQRTTNNSNLSVGHNPSLDPHTAPVGMPSASNLNRHSSASASNSSIHSNLSAALKDNVVPSHLYGQGHGFSFLLDPLAYEGPNQNFASASNQTFLDGETLHAYSESLPSERREPPNMYTAPILKSSEPNLLYQSPNTSMHPGPPGPPEPPGPPGVNKYERTMNPAKASTGNNSYRPGLSLATNLQGNTLPQNNSVGSNNFSLLNMHSNQPMILPQTISGVPGRNTSMNSPYYPYPVGPSAILSGSLPRQNHSLVNVADHFNNLRLNTPHDFDDVGSVVSVSNAGFSGLNPVNLSLIEPGSAFPQDIDSSLYFEPYSNSFGGSSLNQNLPLHTQENSVGTSWTESYFDDTPPPGSVSTTISAATPVNKMSVLPKKKTKKIKTKNSEGTKSTGTITSGTPRNQNHSFNGDVSTVTGSLGALKPGSSMTNPISPGVNLQCTNCHTKTTPLWRRNPQGEALCNACGLFFKLHGTVRPLSLKTDVIKKRQRGQGSGSLSRKGSLVSVANINTRGSVSGSMPKGAASGNRDGDDFNPTPIKQQPKVAANGSTTRSKAAPKTKQGNRPASAVNNDVGIKNPRSPLPVKEATEMKPKNTMKGNSPLGVHDSSLHFTAPLRNEPLDSIHEFGKDAEWQSIAQKNVFMGEEEDNLGQWDWLSMNL